jgi:hypothetical protein
MANPGSAQLRLSLVQPARDWRPGSTDISYRILDLRTGTGFDSEDGVPLIGVRCEGSAMFKCASYALLYLALGDPSDWPESAPHAWSGIPERVFFDEVTAFRSGPVRRAPAMGAPWGPPDHRRRADAGSARARGCASGQRSAGRPARGHGRGHPAGLPRRCRGARGGHPSRPLRPLPGLGSARRHRGLAGPRAHHPAPRPARRRRHREHERNLAGNQRVRLVELRDGMPLGLGASGRVQVRWCLGVSSVARTQSPTRDR